MVQQRAAVIAAAMAAMAMAAAAKAMAAAARAAAAEMVVSAMEVAKAPEATEREVAVEGDLVQQWAAVIAAAMAAMAMAAAEMVVSAMEVATDQEVLARVAVGGAGTARAGCTEVRAMAARRLGEGWAVARLTRARTQRRAVRSSRR